MEYEYKTYIVSRYYLMETFELGMWIIPDVPPPGVVPPTPDEIKQMYFEKIRLYLPYDKVKRLSMLSPEAVTDGWETVFPDNDVSMEGFRIHSSRQLGPMGWTTSFGPESLEVLVRRPIPKAQVRRNASLSRTAKTQKTRTSTRSSAKKMARSPRT